LPELELGQRLFPDFERAMTSVIFAVVATAEASKITPRWSDCAPSGFRTPDPLIKSQLLYQLS
jgi:hypothetical protein